jgi:hypothetical protein
MSTATALAPATPTPEEQAILAAYQKTKRHGLEFGRLCYDYGQKYGAQGSANNGLAQFLRKSNINEGTAYYWIAKHKASIGEGIPCPSCTETFPSKSQLKKHQRKAHAVPTAPRDIYAQVAPTPQMPTAVPAVKDDPELTGCACTTRIRAS